MRESENNVSNRLALKPAQNMTSKNVVGSNARAEKNMKALVDKLQASKKKKDIISGQNNRIANGNSLRVTTEKDGVQTSRPIGL